MTDKMDSDKKESNYLPKNNTKEKSEFSICPYVGNAYF